MIVSCSGQVQKSQKLVNSLTNEKIEIRGSLVKVNESEFRFDYYDIYEKDSHFKFLESKGYQDGAKLGWNHLWSNKNVR